MNTHNLESLLRTRARHAPPPELDARVRQMIAAHPHHAAAPFVPGPFTWRDWCHVALALSLVPVAILSFCLVMPSNSPASMSQAQHHGQMSSDDDWCQAYLTRTAQDKAKPPIGLFQFRPSNTQPPDG